MLKVGDCVVVRSWESMVLEYGDEHGTICKGSHFIYSMRKYCKTIVTLDYFDEYENIYRIKEDGGRWCWNEYMFEKPQNSIRYLLHQKMEDVVNV